MATAAKPGHNRRELAQNSRQIKKRNFAAEEVVVVEKPKKKRKQRLRACGEDSHTAKNCPYKPLPADADIGPKEWSVAVGLGGSVTERVNFAQRQSTLSSLTTTKKKKQRKENEQ